MLPKTSPFPTVHNADLQRFEVPAKGDIAFAHYVQEGSLTIFDHTYVPDAFRGKGMAATLVRTALNEARQLGWRIVPRCPFVAGFIERNPEFADLLARPPNAPVD